MSKWLFETSTIIAGVILAELLVTLVLLPALGHRPAEAEGGPAPAWWGR